MEENPHLRDELELKSDRLDRDQQVVTPCQLAWDMTSAISFWNDKARVMCWSMACSLHPCLLT